MKNHLSCCSGKAGFTFSFDNGKIIYYQDHYKNLGDVPFSIYYDFETTTDSVVFFDAKMFVVSYSMVVAFHPDLNIRRLVIFRSYDQGPNALISLTHFQALGYDFFDKPDNYNKVTLKQLEDAAFSVQNREKNTALAEMFSIELKFIVDCLKFWFNKKHKVLDLDLELKADFKQNNPLTRETICCLCHFPIDPRAKNGWSEHVFNSQYLFLENISSEKQIRQMGIDKFEIFSQKQNTILDELDPFCASIKSEKVSSASEHEDSEIENIIERIKKINTSMEDERKATKEKRNAFLYQHAISSMPTDKVKGDFPISDKFLCNMIAIVRNKRTIHHSHMTGKIIGYAHDFCNQKCRENYYTIPVLTDNHFRFDFFFIFKRN